jgi:hypothetical protein
VPGGLAVDIEDGARGPGREGREQHGLQHAVRIAFHQVAVLEDAGLAFLAVDDEVLRRSGGGPAPRPLHGRLEVGATPAGEAGGAHLLDDRLRPAVVECAREGLVGAVTERVADVVRISHATALE